MFALALAAGWQPCCPAASELPDFGHYQIILDRKPFGEIVPPETAEPGAAAGGALAQNLELRAIIDDGETMRVGMFDKGGNRSFYISLGETVEQLELVSVDYDAEEAVLRKMDETIVLKLRPETEGGAAPAAAAPAMQPKPDAPPFHTAAPTAGPRRPFFAELKRRREAAGTNLPAPRGFAEFFKQAAPPPGAATNPPSPFGPFTPVAGTNAGFVPFGAPSAAPSAPDAAVFSPFNPNQPSASVPETVPADNLLQLPAESVEQPLDAVPFQFITE